MPRTRFTFAALAVATLAVTADARGARNPRAELTVTPAWLAQHLKDPDLVLLHVGDKGEYDKAHIAGARFVTQRDISVSNHDHEKDTGLILETTTDGSLR